VIRWSVEWQFQGVERFSLFDERVSEATVLAQALQLRLDAIRERQITASEKRARHLQALIDPGVATTTSPEQQQEQQEEPAVPEAMQAYVNADATSMRFYLARAFHRVRQGLLLVVVLLVDCDSLSCAYRRTASRTTSSTARRASSRTCRTGPSSSSRPSTWPCRPRHREPIRSYLLKMTRKRIRRTATMMTVTIAPAVTTTAVTMAAVRALTMNQSQHQQRRISRLRRAPSSRQKVEWLEYKPKYAKTVDGGFIDYTRWSLPRRVDRLLGIALGWLLVGYWPSATALGFGITSTTESPRRNILLMKRSRLTACAFLVPLPVLGTSVHHSRTLINTCTPG